MAYATIQDYTVCFSENELICLTDRDDQKTGQIDVDRAQCALDRACARITTDLACCGFDLKKIKGLISEGSEFSILKDWALDIARYLLHDNLCEDDGTHIVVRRYLDYQKAVKHICECGIIVDDEGNTCCVESSACFAIESDESCLPDKFCCCNKTPCCCTGSKY